MLLVMTISLDSDKPKVINVQQVVQLIFQGVFLQLSGHSCNPMPILNLLWVSQMPGGVTYRSAIGI